jgi:hypothetical protein
VFGQRRREQAPAGLPAGEFNYVGRYGDDGFVEDYTSVVRGEPIGGVVVIRFDEPGQAVRIVVSHRPLRSVLLWSQLMGEHFAGTPYAKVDGSAATGSRGAVGRSAGAPPRVTRNSTTTPATTPTIPDTSNTFCTPATPAA